AASSVACVRPHSASAAPSCANSSAVTRPMPRLPPVMTATFPSRMPMLFPPAFGVAADYEREACLTVHATPDRVDRHYVVRAHAGEVDLRPVAFHEPGCLLLGRDEAQLEQ